MRLLLAAVGLLSGTACSSVAIVHSEWMEYDITWVGVSVGVMTVRTETDEKGITARSIAIRNRKWISLVYPVDNVIECVIENTPDGLRHTVTKKMRENEFAQNDTLTLFPDRGCAVWSNGITGRVEAFDVPKGSRDYVSFFFDLRDAARGSNLWANGEYQLVMDDGLHRMTLTNGCMQRLRTPYGRLSAVPVTAVSRSPILFQRNKPRRIWVAVNKPVVIFADVQTRFGVVRSTLSRWEVDGNPVSLVGEMP